MLDTTEPIRWLVTVKRTDQEILESYAEVLGNLKDMLDEDIMVIISNRTHRIKYFPGKKMVVDLTKVGTELSETNSMRKAMESGKASSQLVDKKLFGFPFLTVDYPIRNDDGEVIGCVGIGKSLEKEHQIEEISHSLASAIEQISASLQQVSAGSQELADAINSIMQMANDSAKKIRQIDQVIQVITDIAKQSNLLGLNAAIEAARVGEHGKGFGVVAGEMRRLAAQSKDSAAVVTQILTEMVQAMEGIIHAINQVGSIAEGQAAATQQIAAAIQDVSHSSQNLAEFAKIH